MSYFDLDTKVFDNIESNNIIKLKQQMNEDKQRKEIMNNKANERFTSFKIKGHEPLITFPIFSERKDQPAISGWSQLTKSATEKLYPNNNVGVVTGINNNLTVVDIDVKGINIDENQLFKKYNAKTIDDIIKVFNTPIIKTPSGGIHIYFQYDSTFITTRGNNIDIRNDGGYVCAPPSSIKEKKYELINDVEIKPFDEGLKKWLIDEFGNRYLEKEKKEEKEKKDNQEEIINVDKCNAVKISEDEITYLLNKLPVDIVKSLDYRGNYYLWVVILRACKYAGHYKAFDEWSKGTKHDNYDEHKNRIIWNHENATIYNFVHLLTKTNQKNIFTYKKITNDNFDDTKVIYDGINTRVPLSALTDSKNVVIKSDVGTGKSYIFRKYIFDHVKGKNPFISLSSRVMLVNEQYNDFMKEQEERKTNYKLRNYVDNDYFYGDSVFITPESSIRLTDYNFSKYIVFIDEFNSVLEHIITSPTCKKDRRNIYVTFIKMITMCKKLICADCDISKEALKFLDDLKIKYKLYINTHQNYKNVEITIINNEQEFYEKMNDTPVYMVASDSMNVIDRAYDRMNDKTVVKLTSEDDIPRDFKMDDHDKIMFSPKVIYGLNSIKKRVVFCHYTGTTITPVQYIQQIARSRNIEHIYIYYPDRKSNVAKYESLKALEEEYEGLFKINEKIFNKCVRSIKKMFEDDDNEEENNNDLINRLVAIDLLFNKIFYAIEYKNDCYDTNKYLHFIDILNARGFKIKEDEGQIIMINNKEEKKRIKDKKIEEFNEEKDNIKRKIKYLEIPSDEVENYKDFLIDSRQMTNHINYCSFFYGDNIEKAIYNILKSENDYEVSNAKNSIVLKFNLLNEMLKKLNIDKNRIHEYKPDNKTIENVKDLEEQYRAYYPRTEKKLNFSKGHNIYTTITAMYNNMFGDVIVATGQKPKYEDEEGKQKQIRLYKLREDVNEYNKKLYSFRHNDDTNKICLTKRLV